MAFYPFLCSSSTFSYWNEKSFPISFQIAAEFSFRVDTTNQPNTNLWHRMNTLIVKTVNNVLLVPLVWNCELAIKLSKWIDEKNKCNLWQRHRAIWNVINRKWLTAILTREMIESKLVRNRQMSWGKSSGKYIGWKILDNKSIINMNHSFQSLFSIHCAISMYIIVTWFKALALFTNSHWTQTIGGIAYYSLYMWLRRL